MVSRRGMDWRGRGGGKAPCSAWCGRLGRARRPPPHPPPKAHQGLGALGRLSGASGLLGPCALSRVWTLSPPCIMDSLYYHYSPLEGCVLSRFENMSKNLNISYGLIIERGSQRSSPGSLLCVSFCARCVAIEGTGFANLELCRRAAPEPTLSIVALISKESTRPKCRGKTIFW